MEDVQTSKNLYLTIYKLLKQGIRPSVIEKELGVNKQRIRYYTSFFKQQGIAQRIGYGVWEIIRDLTDSEILEEVKKRSTKKSSIGVREYPRINLHAVVIKIPILSGKIIGDDWKIRNIINHWIPKYKHFDNFKGLLIRNNNNKSINIFVEPRDIQNLDEARILPIKIAFYITEFFKKKYNVELDFEGYQLQNTNIAVENKFMKPFVKKGDSIKIDLWEKAEKIFPKDDRNAWASVDNSPYQPSIETNDIKFMDAYLIMPYLVQKIFNDFQEIKQENFEVKSLMKELSQNQVDMSMVMKQISDNMIHLTKIIIENFKDST